MGRMSFLASEGMLPQKQALASARQLPPGTEFNLPEFDAKDLLGAVRFATKKCCFQWKTSCCTGFLGYMLSQSFSRSVEHDLMLSHDLLGIHSSLYRSFFHHQF